MILSEKGKRPKKYSIFSGIELIIPIIDQIAAAVTLFIAEAHLVRVAFTEPGAAPALPPGKAVPLTAILFKYLVT